MRLLPVSAWIVSAAAVAFVLLRFSEIWPLAAVDVGQPKDFYKERAREVLADYGVDHAGFRPFVGIAVRETVLDRLQSEAGADRVAEWAARPNGLVRYYVRFKKPGSPKSLIVVLHPEGEFIGFQQSVEPGETVKSISEADFRARAARILSEVYGIQPGQLEENKFDSELENGITNYRIDLRRPFEGSPSVGEFFTVAVEGDIVAAVGRRLELTEVARQEENRRRGPPEALSQLGFLIMGMALVAIYISFLYQLRSASIELTRPLGVAMVLFLMVFASSLFDANTRFAAWDPVWPAITMWIKWISQQFLMALWALVLGWAFLSAGTGVPGVGRSMDSFWDFVALRWTKEKVWLAALRGGAIGFVCGAAAILVIGALETFFGGQVGLQPRAFYLSILDRQLPALAIVLFFFPVAVVEEAGYRLVAACWVRKFTRSVTLAVILPALVFGMTHTALGFLPPEQPWWGRAVLMVTIGLIWGWAYFRFDFLTVVMSHFIADVVIFCWPLLTSDHPPSRIMAGIAISAGFWPVLLMLAIRAVKVAQTFTANRQKISSGESP